jgi:colanic acid biosynthesis glycosyl transferase WcaI
VEIEIKADAVAVQGLPQQLSVTRPARHPLPQQLPPLPDLLADRNVLVVGINYAPEPSGIAPYTTAMCEYLATRARLVTVLTGLPHHPTWQVPSAYRGFRRNPEQHTPTLHVIRHRHLVPRSRSALAQSAYQASFLSKVTRTSLEEKPDLVVGVTPSVSGLIAAARIAHRYEVPLVAVVHDRPGPRMPEGAARGEAKALQAAARVLALGQAQLDRVRALGVPEDRVELLPLWSHVVPSELEPAEARRRLGCPGNRFTVLHSGEIGFVQGLSTAIEAAAELQRRDEPVDVVLVGEGHQRVALQAMATGLPHVRFAQPAGEDDYPLVLAAADLLLLCERPEVRDPVDPAALASCLMAGRPIVAAVSPDGPTARALAAVGGGYELVPPGDGWALADAVAVLRQADERRRRMSEQAAHYADEHLSATVAMRRLEQALVSALG